MRRTISHASLLSLPALMLAAITLICLPPYAACRAQSYQIDTYSEDDGLPSSYINDITQDHSGRMWFATRSGIAVYDGLTWKTYDLNDGLATLNYDFILEDRSGRIWAITNMRGEIISGFDGDSWSNIPPPASEGGCKNKVSAAAAGGDSNNSLLIAGHRHGGLGYWNGKEWEKPFPREVFDNTVIRWIETAGDSIYIASGKGLWIGPAIPAPDSFRLCKQVPAEEIYSLSFDPETAKLWMVANGWIGWLREGKFNRIPCRHSTSLLERFGKVECQHFPSGGLFFGNPSMLYYFEPGAGFKPVQKKNGLIAPGVSTLYLDREKNLWTGGYRGVSKIVSLRFANYQEDHGLLEDEVSAVLELDSGEIVLGHPCGLTFMSDTISTMRLTSQMMGVRVLDLAQDDQGYLWAAVHSRGLARINESGDIGWYHPGGNSILAVTSVMEDSRGRLWVTTGSDIYLKTDHGFRKIGITVPEGIQGDIGMRKIFEGSDGTIYVATQKSGICSIRQGEAEFTRPGKTYNENSVFAFYQNSSGRKWVGTAAGLFNGEGKNLKRVKTPGPEINRPVYFIMEDRNNRMWFGTDNGACRWDGERLLQFTIENGLIGRETNRAAALQDSRGRIWIGMDVGVSVYREELERDYNIKPAIELISLETPEQSFPLDQQISIPHDQNTLKFRFRAISFINEKTLRFRTWLTGYESGWQGPYHSPRQQIRYINLPPGEYVFHAQAGGYEQPWSDIASSAVITINRPFYSSIWFLAGMSGLLILIVFSVISYISQKRYSRRLEEEVQKKVREKQRIENELQKSRKLEALGIMAGGIAHDFNNFLTAVLGNLSLLEVDLSSDPEHNTKLQGAISAARHASSLTTQLLTFSRGGSPVREAGCMAELIRECASFTLRGTGILIRYQLPPGLWPVEMDASQMSQVINNLLLNAREAMPGGGTIYIQGENLSKAPPRLKQGRYISIEITDEGRGIPEDIIDSIFDPYYSTKEEGHGLGLATSYSIVSKHEGLLTVDSVVGRGTTFTIFLPATDQKAAIPRSSPERESPGHGRILVMDDNAQVRETTSRLLEGLGFTAGVAREGKEAIELYRNAMESNEPFDAVVLDLTVPGGMGGRETIQHLLKIDSEVKAIVASGYSNDDVLANYQRYGFSACLSKPFLMNELRETLLDVLTPATSP